MDESMEEHYYQPKVETVIEETILEETPLDPDAIESLDEAQTVGQEGSTYTNEFTVCKLKYRGQTSDPSLENSFIRWSSIEEFIDNLFQLVQPFIKRAIEFPTPTDPCWSEKEHPTKEDLPMYVSFKDRIQKRSWRMEHVDEHMLLRWANRVLVLQVYIYTIDIQSRPMWDIVTQVLFGNPNNTAVKKIIIKELSEEQKLQAVVKKLKKIHQAYLVPRTDDAYKLWARLIVQQPVRRHRELCFNRPPKKLLQNFVIIGKKENNKRKIISGPAQRSHSSDGFGFEDEVYALRQTVTQIKDLVEMLDRRVELLEEKCQGFKQKRNGVPIKKGKIDSDNGDQNGEQNEEPVIDEPSKDDKNLEGGYSGNPDPLLFHDSIDFVKQEFAESESDG
ncbi:uncharacterized protein LOC135704738 [Ochlerotatus camptorhynchus]|uniref:uncharacterized protein LOC135704738 n=1 Tax=Ochlerotatus camptorhynchus TaxID=644619 RepID=UPI0031CFB66F